MDGKQNDMQTDPAVCAGCDQKFDVSKPGGYFVCDGCGARFCTDHWIAMDSEQMCPECATAWAQDAWHQMRQVRRLRNSLERNRQAS